MVVVVASDELECHLAVVKVVKVDDSDDEREKSAKLVFCV
jgi:hypothetical protein